MASGLIHPLAWLAWLGASVAAMSATRNPLYLFLILGCLALTGWTVRPHSKAPPLPLSPLRFGLLLVTASALFNALTAHVGNTVLLRLPTWLPLLGGSVTLEALVYGAINGLMLAGFLAAFTVLNVALPTHALVRLIPRAFYPVAVVISIAVAFVPTTLYQFQQIREAQMMRGHQVRGLRDWLPLFMPLFVGGLERALQLAEAMAARGFASEGRANALDEMAGWSRSRVPLLAGLALTLAGLLLRTVWMQRAAGLAAILAGGILILLALWLAGQGVERTVYRPHRWTRHDWIVVAGALVVAAVYLLPWKGQDTLHYVPYPRLSWPSLNIATVMASAGLLVPAWLFQAIAPDRPRPEPDA